MIEAKNISKKYGDLEVLHEVSLSVRDGDVIAILGPSGSGKTTFLRAISLLNKSDTGIINLDGNEYDMAHLTRKKILEFRKRIGFVFQNYNLFINKTAIENVTEGLIVAHKIKKKDAKRIAEEALEKVGMLEWKDHYPSQLSGGQQQRVAIARAIALNPSVIFFDEPTSALDPELTNEVLGVIKKLTDEGITMIIVTHEMNFARNVADRIVFMEKGQIIEENTSKLFFDRPINDRISNFINMSEQRIDFVSQGAGI